MTKSCKSFSFLFYVWGFGGIIWAPTALPGCAPPVLLPTAHLLSLALHLLCIYNFPRQTSTVLSSPTSWDLYCPVGLTFTGSYNGISGPSLRKSNPATLFLDFSGIQESCPSLHDPFLLVFLTCLNCQHHVDPCVEAQCQFEVLCDSVAALMTSLHFGNQIWEGDAISGWF